MPRAYGKAELQQLVAESFRAGFELGQAKAVYEVTEIPPVDDLLARIGIEHPENVPIVPGKPRSWHGAPGGGEAA